MQRTSVGQLRAADALSLETGIPSPLGGLTSVWGAATARQRLLPDVIVMGYPGSAMRFLLSLLGAHPQAFACKRAGGSGFFGDAHDRGIRWYAAHFPLRWTAARQARGVEPHAFEWGSYYLSHPLAAERIARFLPDAGVVVLLDDPVERAVAAHQRATACGRERLGLEEALDAEEMRLLGAEERLVAVPGTTSFHHRHHAYVGQGRYAEHLGRLRSVMGEERVHLVDAVRFVADPRNRFAELLDSLGWGQLAQDLWPPDPHRPDLQQHVAVSVRDRLREAFAASDQQLVAWLGETPGWQARR